MLSFAGAEHTLSVAVFIACFRHWECREGVLAKTVTSSQCSSGERFPLAADENLHSPRDDEVMALDLLQVDLRLQSNSVAPAMPNNRSASQIGVALLPIRLLSEEVHRHHYVTSLYMATHRLTASMSHTSGGVFIFILVAGLMSVAATLCFLRLDEPHGSLHSQSRKSAGSPGHPPQQHPAYVSRREAPNTGHPPQQHPAYVSLIGTPPRSAQNSPECSTLSPQAPAASLIMTSDSQIPLSKAALNSSSALPPPICPALILANTEARFQIPVASFIAGNKVTDILGGSGRKLLHCERSAERDGREKLAIASCGAEHDPKATILGNPMRKGQVFEIFGRGDVPYGKLEPCYGGGFQVQVQGRPVMSIECGSNLTMTASSMAGGLLASASKGPPTGHQMWTLKVQAKNDAVLIAACMLAIIFYCQ